MKLTVGSLFAGTGGLELGLEQTGGFKTIWSVEIEDFPNEIRKRHWPDVPQYRDVRTFPPPEGVESPDVIVFGSPCQDLSVAGRRAGIGGVHSGLFFEALRVIRDLQPRCVVWENVRGAFSSDGGRDFRTVLGNLSDLGYNEIEWTMLRASDFGYPHGRARVFVVAYRPGARRKEEGGGADVRKEQGGECLLGSGRGELAYRNGAGLEKRGGQSGDLGEERAAIVGSGGELADDPGERRGAWGTESEGLVRVDSAPGSGGAMENSARNGGCGPERETGRAGGRGVFQTGEQLANARDGQFPVEGRRQEERDGARPTSKEPELGNTASYDEQRDRESRSSVHEEQDRGRCSRIPFAPPSPGLTHSRLEYIIKLFDAEPEKARAIFEAERRETERWAAILEEWPWLAPAVKPGVCHVADGISTVVDASRAPRLRALGNAVVPACAKWVGEKILEWEKRTT